MDLIEQASAAREQGDPKHAVQLLHQAFLALSRAKNVDGVKNVLVEAQTLADESHPSDTAAAWVAQQTRLYLRAWEPETEWDAEIAAHQERLDNRPAPTRTSPTKPQPAPTTTKTASPLQAEPEPAEVEVDLTPLGFWLALAGAATISISVFLPEVSSTTFARVAHNTLIQDGNGWVFLVLALTDLAAIYRAYRSRNHTWAPLISGLLAAGYAIHLGTSSSTLRLCSVVLKKLCTNGTPGIGIYLAGVGGGLLLTGGWFLRGAAPTHTFTTPPSTTSQKPVTGQPQLQPAPSTIANFCTSCGTAYTASGGFCANCGAPRPAAVT